MAYRGATIKLPVGAQGFSGTRNPSQAGPGHLTYVDGIELYGGILRKEGGASKLNSTAISGSPAIVAGINWSPLAGTNQDIIVTDDGDVLKDLGDGLFSVTLASGLSISRDPPPYFMTGGGEDVGEPRKLFLFSAENQVQVVEGNGDTMEDISGPASDWADGEFPTFGVLHAGRIFAGGNASDPHRIYYSGIADHTDFTTEENGPGGHLPIYPGEGEILVGGMSFRGALVLWKYPTGVYVIYTQDPSPTNWRVERITDAVGALNQQSIVQVDNDVLYLDAAGNIHALSATQEFGDLRTSNISAEMELEPFMRSAVDRTLLRRAVGVWYAAKRQAWFAVTRVDSQDNDLRIILGFDKEGPRVFMSRRDTAPSMWMRPPSDDLTPRPAIGDNAGFIWQLDTLGREKDGDAYEMRFETSNTDFQFAAPELATRWKNGQFLEIVAEPQGDWDLTVEVYWDDELTDVVQFNMGVGGAPLGTFVLDTDVLASEVVASQRRSIKGSGRRMRLIGYNAGLGQDVAIAEFYVSLVPGDERIREPT